MASGNFLQDYEYNEKSQMEMILDNSQAGNIGPSQTTSERFHFPFVKSKLSSSTSD